MAIFCVGQKVRCVWIDELVKYNDEPSVVWPLVGEVYTIRQKTHGPFGEPGVRLVEIINRPHFYMPRFGIFPGICEQMFPQASFRPLTETKQTVETSSSLDIFHEIVREVERTAKRPAPSKIKPPVTP